MGQYIDKNEMQFGFVAGHGIKDAIFMLRWSQNEGFVPRICRFGEKV